jgi:hypothetical protein
MLAGVLLPFWGSGREILEENISTIILKFRFFELN